MNLNILVNLQLNILGFVERVGTHATNSFITLCIIENTQRHSSFGIRNVPEIKL